jgi:hypothetical protein
MSGKQAVKKWNEINEANPVTEVMNEEQYDALKKKWID